VQRLEWLMIVARSLGGLGIADGRATSRAARSSRARRTERVLRLISDGAGIMASQPIVGQFLASFKDHPPSQRPPSFSIDQIMAKMEQSFQAVQSN
jgi:hypothetical protein